MLTLDNLLSQNRAPASDEAYVLHAVTCSPFVERLFRKDALLLQDLLQNLHQAYLLSDMQNFLAAQHVVDEISLKRALRLLRSRVMARMIVRDLNGLTNLQEIMLTTSMLAECVINTAIEYLHQWLVTVYGQPVDMHGKAQQLIVIGMGKLGGGELNVSSDIDLIFAYESEGATQGAKPISNQDFFSRLAKKLIAAIDETTENGFVFRVDMRLRPFGSEGAIVCNLDALEDYYQNNGREWERYAWIKGREVTGGDAVSRLLKPFVFRKYLDFGAFASMRDLKIQIQRDVNSKGMHDNIKLGRGGIREIEFIAQVFQLIRGGQDVSLQIKPTLSVLNLLKNKGLLPEKTVTELSEAYVFLRNLEHRLMYVDDVQTQELPKSDEAKARIAKAMNYPNWSAFIHQLDAYRAQVQQHFDATFDDAGSEDTLDAEKSIWNASVSEADAISQLENIGFTEAHETYRRLSVLHQSSRYKQLPELSRQRFDAVMPHVISQAGKMQNADITLTRVMDLLESICRRASYLALLAEHPQAMQLLVNLCSSSPWLTNYLISHPILLDELLDVRTLHAAPDFSAMREELLARLAEFTGDVERQMDVMRHFKHAYIFRFAVQDINGELPLETISDYLSALADLILSVALDIIWPNVRGRHLDVPNFAVIGYGKLGGKELGYASDLDIIFLYDDESPEASEVYARFAQRINNWFNSLTSAGLLYETDLQLRPDGNSGLLVSRVDAFRDYQLNKAWIWEHQALTRARFVAGDSKIGQAFDEIKTEVMTQARDAEILKTEVLAMRERMRKAQHVHEGMFDLKHGVGGIIDVEFLVQYLVLLYAPSYPELTVNIGNIGLLKRMATLKIIDAELAESVADAYRQYRHMQHMLKLQGATQLNIKAEEIAQEITKVTALWRQVFGNQVLA
ncbi:bifunctional [glutamate--ammonia ligase]-adenylyl-L-tyrosine phosphorylase/[glutamate--ammonia-ligase] adenylyltransferase [Methylotenera sp. L2L1]|uniref:bifunctional [glutamate--ammonia ligase]-adenylyl-L-tyrosine phosphorylase/[glutamate--ammonia-ligase] adenylyltransferase n=1 Tax=Methylotenera sp. L2L1 TaxID=1502770 RepID=UPI000564E9D8|nr:bifunctional [glutamate--ammonia ligase]-adenylyl-L-tyrosine phosphorylase/[glutamate--ammonia-ligase] adenylyltransferase [Methylotenera sp. L2L1]